LYFRNRRDDRSAFDRDGTDDAGLTQQRSGGHSRLPPGEDRRDGERLDGLDPIDAAVKKLRTMMAAQSKAAPAAPSSTDASTQEMLQAEAQLTSEFHAPKIPGGNGGVED
jgi:hypothetical protein